MFTTFNLIIIVLVLLIAYWWANQGVFSALLHLIAVIAAGAIALAVWEPLTINLLLRGNAFDDYAWGVALVGCFALSLFLIRLAFDKLAHGNLNMPTWANLIFGFPLGAAAGVLTLGITMIGAGFVQSSTEIAGYRGFARSQFSGRIEYVGPKLWAPVHHWTSNFYQYLSVGALYPDFLGTPLLHYNPDLHRQATLLRDGYSHGRVHGKFSLRPEAARIISVEIDETANRCLVEVRFDFPALDFGHQLTLSASQIRLICHPRGDRMRPLIVHPDAWRQPRREQEVLQRYRFDATDRYITSIPGQQQTRAVIEFPLPENHWPRFIQIRGTRFDLPAPREGVRR